MARKRRNKKKQIAGQGIGKKAEGKVGKAGKTASAEFQLQVDPLYDYKDWLFAPLGLLIFIVYYLTLCPTVPSGDSGELIVVSHRLGVAHPPGYPLYTMIAHLFTYIPFGSIAWRVNLFSAICNLGAAFFIYQTCVRWTKNVNGSLLAAGVFAFSPLVWRYAVVAEVFGMNNLFVAALLFILYQFYTTNEKKWAFIFAITLGLGYSHHHTLVLFTLPILLFTFYKKREILWQPKVLIGCTALVLLGLTPYLYLPWASANKFIFSWGDTTTWEGFKTHFFRSEYGTFQLATGHEGKTNLFKNLKEYIKDVPFQFLILGIVVAIFGIYENLRQRRKMQPFALCLLLGLCTYLIVFHHLANMDLTNRLHYDIHTRFWQMPNLVLSFFLAYGWARLSRFIPKYSYRIAAGLATILIGVQVGYHYKLEDHSQNTTFYDLGKTILDTADKNALMWLRGDVYVNSVRYMQASEFYRTDVKAIPFDLLWWPWMKDVVKFNFPDVTLPGDVYRYKRRRLNHFTLEQLFDSNTQHSMFIGKLRKDEHEAVKTAGYKLWNAGYVYWAQPVVEKFDFTEYAKRAEAFNDYQPPPRSSIRDRSWEAFVYYNYWEREMDRARQVFTEFTKSGTSVELVKYGAQILENVKDNHPKPPAMVFKNLGVAYQKMAALEGPQHHTAMVKAWKKYLEFNPVKDPHYQAIVQVVNQAYAQQNAAQKNGETLRQPSSDQKDSANN